MLVEDMDECIQNCSDCQRECLKTIAELYKDPYHDHNLVTRLQVCADMCNTAMTAMCLESSDHVITCKACYEICYKCQESCEDYKLEHCAEMCQTCGDSCYDMVAGAL